MFLVPCPALSSDGFMLDCTTKLCLSIRAMLSVVITVVCFVCYCCHRTIKKRSTTMTSYRHRWMDTDPNMEIYSVEQVQCKTQVATKMFAIYLRRNPLHTLMTIFERTLLLVGGILYYILWCHCIVGGLYVVVTMIIIL